MQLTQAAKILGSEKKARRGYRMAINRRGGKAFTQVKHAVSKQAGLTQKHAIRYGNIKRHSASHINLEYRIVSRGGEVPLKAFKARESARGVKAAPFGKRQLFAHTFIEGGLWPRRTGPVGGGHVFTPSGGAHWGRPFTKAHSEVYIPVEIVKDESEEAFNEAAKGLPRDIETIIGKMTKGVIS